MFERRITASFESQKDATSAQQRLLRRGIRNARLEPRYGSLQSGAPGFTGPHARILLLANVHPRHLDEVGDILADCGGREHFEEGMAGKTLFKRGASVAAALILAGAALLAIRRRTRAPLLEHSAAPRRGPSPRDAGSSAESNAGPKAPRFQDPTAGLQDSFLNSPSASGNMHDQPGHRLGRGEGADAARYGAKVR